MKLVNLVKLIKILQLLDIVDILLHGKGGNPLTNALPI